MAGSLFSSVGMAAALSIGLLTGTAKAAPAATPTRKRVVRETTIARPIARVATETTTTKVTTSNN